MTSYEPDEDEDEEREPAETRDVSTFADEDHDPLPREWNWQDRLPRGKVVIIAGWREAGKGLVGWNLTAALTTGTPLPGETEPREPASVIGIWDEDDPNEDNAWRARAAGVDLSRVYDMTMLGSEPFELSAARNDNGSLPDLLGFIRTLVAQGRNPRLVIMDPLDNLVMNGSHVSKQGATRLIRRLEFVARRTGVTILVFTHLVETSKDKNGKVGASSKIVDVPRWVYRIERDEDAPDLMILRKHKGNNGDPPPIRYRVIKDGNASRIEWVEQAQVRREERAWRQRDKATIISMLPPDPSAEVQAGQEARRLVLGWLDESGGGTAAQCAESTGLDVETAEAQLTRLRETGVLARRLSLRRAK